MDILRKYRHFVNEAVDSDKEARSLDDVPNEVIETAKKIAGDIFDRVKKPKFEFVPDEGLVMSFYVTEQDFQYIDPNEQLTLEVTEGAKKKRMYEVTLDYLERASETYEVKYIVNFDMVVDGPYDDEDDLDEDDDDLIEDEIGDSEVDAVYQRLLKEWRRNQSKKKGNLDPGEGTRKRLLNQAKQEVYGEDDEWDENKSEIEDIDFDFDDDE
jgi:hypothetical protein